MNIVGEITFGNLLTAASVLISGTALAYSWRNDRHLRQLEYADRIRRAAGTTASVFDRWQALVQQFFDSVQPLIIEVDDLCEAGQATAAARHALVRGIYEQRAAAGRRISEERIETAYIDLYGYDPRVHALFLATVSRLREIDERGFAQLVAMAKGNLDQPAPEAAAAAARCGRVSLCEQCQAVHRERQAEADAVVTAFHAQMLRLIRASDRQILGRQVNLPDPETMMSARDHALGRQHA